MKSLPKNYLHLQISPIDLDAMQILCQKTVILSKILTSPWNLFGHDVKYVKLNSDSNFRVKNLFFFVLGKCYKEQIGLGSKVFQGAKFGTSYVILLVYQFSSAAKVPFCDFTQNESQAPSMCISMWIKVNKWNYLKNPSQEFKNSFCFRFL